MRLLSIVLLKQRRMIINFSELTIPFHRLAPGAILVSPNDGRYLKSIAVDWLREVYSQAVEMKIDNWRGYHL